jgi:PST family polysaccharide transporter
MDFDVHGGCKETMRPASDLAARGFIWTFISQSIRIGCLVLGIVVLSRLLPASDFGLLAMASAVTGFISLFRDFGTTAAVIQRAELTPSMLNSIFWFNLGLGVCLASTLLLLSPVVVIFFSEPRLYEVVWLLALAFPLEASGLVHQALLERASNFKPIALIESVAALIGLGVAIGSAWSGLGVFSLVAQTLMSVAVSTAGLWLVSAWRPGASGSFAELKGLWAFSGNLVGFNVLNYFARSADSILIGRYVGAADLGFYTMAYRAMLWPLQNLSSVVGRALHPVLSRMQTNPERLAQAYLKATAAIVLVSAPLMLGLFVLREPFVRAVLGEQWMPVADMLVWLAPVGLLQSLGTTVGFLYLATGRTDLMFRWGIFACAAIVVALAIGIQSGIKGLLIGYLVVNCILFFPSLMVPLKLIELNVFKLLNNLFPSVVAAAAMAFIVSLTDNMWGGLMDFPGIRLGLLVGEGALIYGIFTFLFQRSFLLELLWILRRKQTP